MLLVEAIIGNGFQRGEGVHYSIRIQVDQSLAESLSHKGPATVRAKRKKNFIHRFFVGIFEIILMPILKVKHMPIAKVLAKIDSRSARTVT